MVLPNNIYNVLKWIMILGVPVSTFLISIYKAIITGDPVAIIAAVFGGAATLAGVIIKVSDVNYNKSIEGTKK